MTNSDQTPPKPETKLYETKKFMYAYMFGVIVYMLLSGYVLVFSGSLFWESLSKGWYSFDSNVYDQHSFWLGYLYGFPSLCGVIGAILVLATSTERFFRFKVLLFVPAAVWSAELVLGNFRWGLTYWTQWLYLVPIMTLCIFTLYGVVKKVQLPIFATRNANVTETV